MWAAHTGPSSDIGQYKPQTETMQRHRRRNFTGTPLATIPYKPRPQTSYFESDTKSNQVHSNHWQSRTFFVCWMIQVQEFVPHSSYFQKLWVKLMNCIQTRDEKTSINVGKLCEGQHTAVKYDVLQWSKYMWSKHFKEHHHQDFKLLRTEAVEVLVHNWLFVFLAAVRENSMVGADKLLATDPV